MDLAVVEMPIIEASMLDLLSSRTSIDIVSQPHLDVLHPVGSLAMQLLRHVYGRALLALFALSRVQRHSGDSLRRSIISLQGFKILRN